MPELHELVQAEIGRVIEEVSDQKALIARIQTALRGKAAGGAGLPTQEKTVEITENGTVEVLPDDGYALSKVTAVVDVAGSAVVDPRDLYQRVEYIEPAEAAQLSFVFI